MPGPPPDPNSGNQTKRRNADLWTTLPADGYSGEIPELPFADEYLEITITWYQTWAHSPQATQFTTTDWQVLHRAAPLVNRYWLAVNDEEVSANSLANVASTIRQIEAGLGATSADRLKNRWIVAEDRAATTKTSDDLAERRQQRRARLAKKEA